MESIHQTILSLCEQRGNHVAFRHQRETGGYRALACTEVRERALRLGAYLRSQGVGRGDRVMLVSENGPEWPVAALAALNLGAVLVPVAAVGSDLEIENTFRSARPKFCFFSDQIAGAQRLGTLLRESGVAHATWSLQREEPLAEWLRGHSPVAVDETTRADDTAVLIFTSGTTGTPKGVPITHGNILANARAVIEVIPVSDRDRVVSVLPLSHMLEFTGGFVLTSIVGAEVTYVKSFKPEDLLLALHDSRATVLIAVPLLFEVIARKLQAKLEALPGPLPALFQRFGEWTRRRPGLGKWLFLPVHRALGGHLRFFVAGGSRLHPQTFEFFRGFGIPILQGYGLTETSPVLTFTTLADAGADHVGRAIPGVEVGIFGERGEPRVEGVEGEIWARGPSVFGGYLDSTHNEGAFHGTWFKTGDLGTRDEAGLIRITGRKKDIIVTAAGKNVYPEEIESLVLASGDFLEASVIGLKDGSGHEKIVLVVVPDRSRFAGHDSVSIRQLAAERASGTFKALAEYKWPQKVVVTFDDLPKTSTRKVKKHELRKSLEAQGRPAETAAGSKLELRDPLEAAIARGISAITKIPAEEISPQASLSKDLGLDSLTLVELVGQVEAKFQTQLEAVDFAAVATVQDLLAAFRASLAGRGRAGRSGHVFFAEFAPRSNRWPWWSVPRRLFNLLVRRRLERQYSLKVEGLENLAGGGPFVLTPNHASHFDLLSVAASVPPAMVHRTYAVAAKDYFFDRTWKALAARLFVNAIPFDRKARVHESMKRCREVLDEGSSLVIFPEGTRSPDGQLQDFKPGVGQLLAGHPTAQAVPVFIDGAHRIMPKGSKRPGSGSLRVCFGKPISFRDLAQDPEGFRQVAERLRAEVVDLARGRLH